MSSSPSRQRLSWRRCALGALAVACLSLAAPAWEPPARARPGDLAGGLSDLYERVSPAVVRIVSHRVARQSATLGTVHHESALFRRLVATGIVLDDHGCVVTSDRAAQPGDSVVVHFPDGSYRDARFIGQNANLHVSVLRLEGDRTFTWLTPRALRLGELPDWVAAVAYDPWGADRRPGPSLTLAQGNALAHERMRCGDSTATVWRFRAPLFPGNAGGALLSLDGEWLGLITGVVQGESSGEGIAEEGVIVPAGLVARAVMEIEAGRSATAHGFLGVRTYRRPVTASDSLWRGMGVIVSEVLAGGPAERHGVRPGDVILSFGDTPVADAAQLTEMVRRSAPGSAARLQILRAGMPQTLQVQLGDQTSGEAALAQRREMQDERRALERQIRRAEEQLQLLRQRWERLAPSDADTSPPGRSSRGGS